MINIVITENYQEIITKIEKVIAESGYSLVDEPQSGGALKIIQKLNNDQDDLVNKKLSFLKVICNKKESNGVYKDFCAKLEKKVIESALAETDGNKLKAAKILGINRNTLSSKIKRFKIKINQFKIV
jgi:DNA-binding protein Fis